MPLVDVMDDTFLRAPRAQVVAATAVRWPAWLPALDLRVQEDRGPEGVRWAATTAPAARVPLAGSAEVWLEEVPGGTVAHLYVRLDPVRLDPVRLDPARLDPARAPSPGRRGARRARRLPDRLRRTWKRGLHAWKDSLEGDRST